MENNYDDIKLPALEDSMLYRMIRGAVSKEYVIKKYGNKRVIAKYPDMSGIIPTARQVKQRNVFKKAVEFAGTIYTDEKLKRIIQEFTGTKKGLFQAAIRYYFLMHKMEKAKRSRQTNNLLRAALQKGSRFATTTPHAKPSKSSSVQNHGYAANNSPGISTTNSSLSHDLV